MSLRLTSGQALALVQQQAAKPVDVVFPDRRTKMAQAICTGCGKDEGYLDFVDNVSVIEWELSGLCQSCQDGVFGG